MDFVFADSLGIESNLIALRPDTQPLLIHFYQHTGNIIGSAERIGNLDKVDASAQLRYFFDAARHRNSDLVLTPEYSCPLTNIFEIISNDSLWPASGKLWAIGCESITREELSALSEHCNRPNIYIHNEAESPENNKDFYDPLIYLFRGLHEGRDKLIVLIQFKTAHMGARIFATERDHLIEGRIIYILRNRGESNRFISFICSEAMNFEYELTREKRLDIGWSDVPYFVFNPQANPDPTHADFISFRKFVLKTERKELLSLNWNSRTTYGEERFVKYGTSRSGIYTQSSEVDLREQRFRNNHSQGIYYFRFGANKHAFLLNSNADIFLVRLAPVRILGDVDPQVIRDGPQVIKVESYELETKKFLDSTGKVSDGHLAYFASVGCRCNYLLNESICVIKKERLVCLSTGIIKSGASLVKIPEIQSFEMKQDAELNVRITVIDDDRPDARLRKSGYVSLINDLICDIIPNVNENHFPESIRDLRNENIEIGFSSTSEAEGYKFNVIRKTGESLEATMICVGTMSKKDAKKIFDNAQSLFEYKSEYKRRVIVYYCHGRDYLPIYDEKAGIIGHTENEDGPTITNTQK